MHSLLFLVIGHIFKATWDLGGNFAYICFSLGDGGLAHNTSCINLTVITGYMSDPLYLY